MLERALQTCTHTASTAEINVTETAVPASPVLTCSCFHSFNRGYRAIPIRQALCWTQEYMHAKSLQSCPTLCDPMNYSPPGSAIHGIFQVRILEWVAMPSSRGLSRRKDLTCVSCIAGEFFTTEPPGKPSPHIIIFFFLVVKTFKICSLSSFQVYNTAW